MATFLDVHIRAGMNLAPLEDNADTVKTSAPRTP